MSMTNDRLKKDLEAKFPGYDVEVEGIGTNLTPFRIHFRGADGHFFNIDTSLTEADVVRIASEKAKKQKNV